MEDSLDNINAIKQYADIDQFLNAFESKFPFSNNNGGFNEVQSKTVQNYLDLWDSIFLAQK